MFIGQKIFFLKMVDWFRQFFNDINRLLASRRKHDKFDFCSFGPKTQSIFSLNRIAMDLKLGGKKGQYLIVLTGGGAFAILQFKCWFQ